MTQPPAAAPSGAADPSAATTMAAPRLAPAAGSARGRYMVLLAAFLGWMFDGLEQGIFPQVARPSLQSLLPGAAEQDIIRWHQQIDAMFLVGAALGGLVFGYLGDKVGRVRAMSASILVYSLFTGLCYFARSPVQIGLLRFVSAIGMGGEWSLGVALVMEVWPARHRPLLAGVIGAASNVGFLLISSLCYAFPVTAGNWRWVMLAGAAPALLTFFIRLFVPESERWQASQRRGPTAPLREAFGRGTRRPMGLAIAFASVPLLATWGAVQKIPAWVGNLPVAGQRGVAAADGALLGVEGGPAGTAHHRQGLEVTAVLPGSSAARAGIVPGDRIEGVGHTVVASADDVRLALAGKKPGDKIRLYVFGGGGSTPPDPGGGVLVPLDRWQPDPQAKAVTGMLMAVGAIVGCLVAPLLGAALGRRPAYFLLCLGALVACAVTFRGFDRYGGPFLAMTFVTGGVSAAFYGWLPLYLPELFPTRVRATAQGIAYNFGRVFAAGGALAGGQLVALWGDYGRMGATLSLVYLIGMVLIWFAPETKGKPLPE